MGYMTDGLTFNTLRGANINRQQEWPGNDKADVAFRALEVAGEVGELCEKVKKFLRAARGIKGTTASKDDIADEMGDLMVSLDLLANELGIDLGRATKSKFNQTTIKYGMRTYIGDDGDWHLKAERDATPAERAKSNPMGASNECMTCGGDVRGCMC